LEFWLVVFVKLLIQSSYIHTYTYIHIYIYNFYVKIRQTMCIYIYTYNTFKFLAYNSAGLTQAPSLNPKWDLKARNEGFYWMYYQAWSGVMTCYDSAFGWTYGDELFGMILILW
jgi:hypothetical protein